MDHKNTFATLIVGYNNPDNLQVSCLKIYFSTFYIDNYHRLEKKFNKIFIEITYNLLIGDILLYKYNTINNTYSFHELKKKI